MGNFPLEMDSEGGVQREWVLVPAEGVPKAQWCKQVLATLGMGIPCESISTGHMRSKSRRGSPKLCIQMERSVGSKRATPRSWTCHTKELDFFLETVVSSEAFKQMNVLSVRFPFSKDNLNGSVRNKLEKENRSSWRSWSLGNWLFFCLPSHSASACGEGISSLSALSQGFLPSPWKELLIWFFQSLITWLGHSSRLMGCCPPQRHTSPALVSLP